jgi:hypothetical protein
VGDEHVGELKDLSHAQRINATEVEEHSPPLIVKPDEEDRIFKYTVDETGREPIGHNLRSTTPASPPQGLFNMEIRRQSPRELATSSISKRR